MFLFILHLVLAVLVRSQNVSDASVEPSLFPEPFSWNLNYTDHITVERNVDGFRENATFLVLCRNSELYELLETIQNVNDRFNHNFHYDWVFLNDDVFTQHFIDTITAYIPQGSLLFGKIPHEQWSYPSWINQTHALVQRTLMAENGVVYGDSELYRHMCRYYLGFFYKHPLVAQYQYYWRIEPGVKFYCDIDYDVFTHLRQNEKKYGFVLLMFEYRDTIPSLWHHFMSFLADSGIEQSPLLKFVQNDDAAGSYNLCHFWTNFEIADLLVFNSPEYNRMFEYLDRTGGFYYERWGDAPVHSLAVSAFLQPNEIEWFDIGYYHPPYTECPQLETFRLQKKCSCDPELDFSFSFLSCTAHMLKLMEHTR